MKSKSKSCSSGYIAICLESSRLLKVSYILTLNIQVRVILIHVVLPKLWLFDKNTDISD